MIPKLNPTQKGILLALMGYTGFSVSDASAKFLTGHYSTMLVITFITLSASVFLLALSPWLGGLAGPRPHTIKFHLLRTIINFSISILVVMAFARLPLASIYTMIFAMPFIAALLAIPLYKESVTSARWVAIIVGFGGVLIAMRPSPAGFDLDLLLPLGVALGAAVMWIVSRSLDGESAFSMGFYPVFGTFLLTLPFVLTAESLPAPGHIPFFMICGAGVSAGMICLSLAFRAAPSAAVSPFQYSQMIWGLVFGYVLFSDIPDFWTMIGAAIIIASGLGLIFSERGKARV